MDSNTIPRFKSWLRIGFAVVFSMVIAFYGSHYIGSGNALAPSISESQSNSFNFGYDFDTVEPDFPNTNAQADSAGLSVLSKTPGAIVDQSMDGFGAEYSPETYSGVYNSKDFAYPDNTMSDRTFGSRITMINNAGDIPVVSLVGEPSWMFGCATMNNNSCTSCYNSNGSTYSCTTSPCDPDTFNGFYTPPCPSYYPDYANLVAYVAQQFPQIKYFIVWNEFKGFYNSSSGIDAANYTSMYNDAYTAIKKVRPDAQVGGPYDSFTTLPLDGKSCNGFTVCSPTYGYTVQNSITAMQYWLANKVGADFVAMDGKTEIAGANNGYGDNTVAASPLDASEKYAAIDDWLRSQTNLPIWWMESHIQPCNAYNGSNCDPSTTCQATTCWSDNQAAASRIATLALMNSSGATVGLWWQPQEDGGWQDQGLWTDTNVAGGGQPTTLDQYLNEAAGILRQPLTVLSGQPDGVLVATAGSQVLLVNTLNSNSSAVVNGVTVPLTGGQLVVEPIPSIPSKTPTSGGGGSAPGQPSSSSGGSKPKVPSSSGSSSVVSASSSASNPTTASDITLNPPNSNLPIAYVLYYLGNKEIAKVTKPPFTYNLKTAGLTGCNEVTIKTTYKNNTTSTSFKDLCIKLTASKFYDKTKYRITFVAITIVAGVIIWFFLGHRQVVKLFHTLPFIGKHLVNKPSPASIVEPNIISPDSGNKHLPSL